MSTERTRTPAALSCRRIAFIADRVARRYGLTRLSYKAVRSMYDAATTMPIITSNKKGHLWVDKYYIAYCLKNGPVRYVYLTQYHIEEEIESYAEATVTRGRMIQIPADVRDCFSIAMRFMMKTGKDTWILTEEPAE